MIKYMLDTNICIYLIKKKPKAVLQHFSVLTPDKLCISSVTLSELEYGVSKSQQDKKNREALYQFILPLNIMSFDEMAAHHYGKIRAYLEKKGEIIGSLDLMIAAHAKSLDNVLVTNNTKEFNRVPGLKMDNWVT